MNGCPIRKLINLTSIFSIFEETFNYDFSYSGKCHNFWKFICVINGSLGVSTDNDVFILNSGQAILHKPMEFHQLWSEKNTKPHVIIFSFTMDLIPSIKKKQFHLTKNDMEILHHLTQKADQIFERQNQTLIQNVRPGMEYELHLFVDTLERLLLQIIKENSLPILPRSNSSSQKYKIIIQVLEQAIYENLSLDELAARCCMSTSSMKKIFAKYAGKSIMAYFNELKIQRAIQLLDEGYSIVQISFLLGFSNQNYFSTVFKRIMKQPPSVYQKARV